MKRRPTDTYLSGFLLVAALLFAGLLVSQQSGSPTGLVPGALITFAACGNVNESANITANIDATGLAAGACFNITRSNLTLDCQGFKINGPNSLTGISLFLTPGGGTIRNVTITNCFIANFTTGIAEDTAVGTFGDNITVSNSTFFDVATGISLTQTAGGIIAGNNFTNLSTGLEVFFGSDTPKRYAIENNTAYNVTTTLFNIADVEQTTVSNNTIQSSFRFIRIATSVNAPNLTIRGNTYHNTSNGIEFVSASRDVLVANNTAGNNTFGILFGTTSRNNTIVNNSFADNRFGVAFTGSAADNRIENNTFTRNTETGILVNNSAALNILKNNTFVDNLFGISLRGGANNSILNSTINGTRGAINVTVGGFDNLINNTALVQNATFEHQNDTFGPTILIYVSQVNVTSRITFSTVLNVSRNRVFVNATAAPFLNTSADIIIHTIAIKPNATMDPEDDGTFAACPDPRCVALASTSGRMLFRVSQFTAYATNDTAPVTATNTSVSANATFNGTINTTGDAFGFAVGAGDFNGDGIKDHVFGAPFAPLSLLLLQAGKVYVVYGVSPFTPGNNITQITNITVTGSNASSRLGRSVAAGDLNGDGVDDLIYSAAGVRRVGILFGKAGMGNVAIFENQSNVTINVSALNDISLAVGDFNNDSVADLAIGQSESTNVSLQGRVDVLYGRASWPTLINLSRDANLTFNGTAPGDRFGWAVAAGDVNGDGVVDLLVSAARRNITGVPGVGEAYAFFGGSGLAPAAAASANVTLQGEPAAFGINQTNATTGFALYGQADVNNDSIKDIILGAPRALAPDSPAKFDAGAAYIVFGRTTLSGTINLSNANVTLYGVFGPPEFGGTPSGERAGFALFGRDVTNDSFDDLFIGAPLADFNGVSDTGIVYLVYGRAAWPRFINLSTANETFTDSVAAGFFGFALANGSVLIGAPDAQVHGPPSTNNLVEDVVDTGFPGSGAGLAFDIKSPAAAGGGGGGGGGAVVAEGRAGGGSATSGARCTTGLRGEKGFYSYLGFRACNDPNVQRTVQNPAYRHSVINEGYTECCECRPSIRCNPGIALIAEEVPKPPCQGLIKEFKCGEPFPTITPGGAFPWKQSEVEPAWLECCAQKPAGCPGGFIGCYPEPLLGTQKYYDGLEFHWYWPPDECPEKTKRVPCDGNLYEVQEDAPGQFSDADIEAWRSQCCPPTTPCLKKPYDVVRRSCAVDPITGAPVPKIEINTKHYAVNDPPCKHVLSSEAFKWIDCPAPPVPKNKCWNRGDPVCLKSITLPFVGTVATPPYCGESPTPNYKGNPLCQAAAPAPNVAFSEITALHACEVRLAPVAVGPGGASFLFDYPGLCNEQTETGVCQPECMLCPSMLPPVLVALFQGLPPPAGLWVGPVGGPWLPMNFLNCYPQQTTPQPVCVAGSTDPACASLPVPEETCAAGSCPPPPCAGPTCDPPSNVIIDSPPPTPPTTPPNTDVVPPPSPLAPPPTITPPTMPTITPVPVAPLTETPEDFFCVSASAGQGPVSLSAGGEVDRSSLPPGYSVVSVTKVDCAGNYVDMTLNVPDNYEDLKAFMLRADGKAPLGSETLDSAKCGTAWTEDIRRQQVSTWKAPSIGYEELTAIEKVQSVFQPTDAERIVSSGQYQVELMPQEIPTEMVEMQLASTSPITVRLSSPTFNVPQAAHPNLVIIGTPLLVTVTPPFAGRARITMPYAVPAFIDATSIGMYVRIGDQWRYLGGEFDQEAGIISAEVDDLSLLMDDAGTVMFAVMGITCATCPNIQIDKVYDGGSRKAVFLVHGFTTDRLRWQAFIDDLVHTNSDWQIWAVSYPLAMTSEGIASEMSSLIEQHAAEFDKVSFIAHSIGGILSQKAMQHGLDNQLVWPKKVADVILAGQPGLGSPSADVYGRLFAALVNLKSATMVWNQRSPLLSEAVAGTQVPRAPGVEYFAIAGRQSYPFTYDLFKTQEVPTEIVGLQLAGTTSTYLPNDGIISVYSARTVGEQQITDACKHYFEVPRTHTDLLDDWLPRRVMQRALFRNDALESPDKAIVGYNKYVHVVDTECKPGTLVVIGKPIPESATKDPLNCKCGDGVCGDGENDVNCPSDCVKDYKYQYWCRVMPWMIGPLVALLVLLTTVYVFRAIKKHERGRGAAWISMLAALILLLIIGHYLFCGFTMPLSILVLVFVLSLLGFTMVHLHKGLAAGGAPGGATPAKPKKGGPLAAGGSPGGVIPGKFDDSSIRELERLLEKARGKLG